MSSKRERRTKAQLLETVKQLWKEHDGLASEIRQLRAVCQERNNAVAALHEQRDKIREENDRLRHAQVSLTAKQDALLYSLQLMRAVITELQLKQRVGAKATAGFAFVTRADGSCGWEKIQEDEVAMAAGSDKETK